MREILQFEADDLTVTMGWYLTGNVTMRQLVEALNALLRNKAESERIIEERVANRPSRFPTYF